MGVATTCTHSAMDELPLPDGQAFRLGGEHGAADIARWSKRDAEQLP